MKTTALKFIVAVILAAIVGDAIHIYYGHFVSNVVIYNSFINTMSFLTKSLETFGIAIVYYLLGDRLYFNSRFIRAVILTILVCLIKDGFIRQPFMNILLGNSIWDSVVRESQIWFSSLAVSLVITFMINPINHKIVK